MPNNEETQQELDALAQLRERYPGMDDQTLYSQVISDLNKGDEGIKQAKSFVDLLNKNEEAANFLTAMSKYPHNPSLAFHAIPKEVLQTAIDTYDIEPDEEADAEQYRAWKKEREDKAAREKLLDDNYTASGETIRKFAADNGMDPEEWQGIVDTQLLKPIGDGSISEEILRGLYLSRNFDNILQAEREKALTEGRNQSIEQQTMRHQPMTNEAPVEAIEQPQPMYDNTDSDGYEDGSAWLRVAQRETKKHEF